MEVDRKGENKNHGFISLSLSWCVCVCVGAPRDDDSMDSSTPFLCIIPRLSGLDSISSPTLLILPFPGAGVYSGIGTWVRYLRHSPTWSMGWPSVPCLPIEVHLSEIASQLPGFTIVAA
ncbi:hypothetical protein GGS23DRAFT_556767 [Durotheca rogersii]|uniref:uncharacterized protein n=1 Tax=Durotheca rogersii TaxID=419775 RepID=UPI00221E478D|nr:uncharacterized protein GGS23DRAFT_556767 [Durotheca rogersii]KAI5866366.1 hypothetical protein GGS23DRAFT_556767 [Durotheca rogersii]